MRSLLAALALLAAGAARADAPAAWVWLPPTGFMQWSELDRTLRDRSSLKLTIALAPSHASPLAKSALAPWLAEGRVELAARLEGDPFLPLVGGGDAARAQGALEQAAESREELAEKLGAPPAGVVPGAGWLDAALAGALGASGAEWVLAGPYVEGEKPWAAAGRAVLVPARRLPAEPDDSWSAAGAAVYDESASTSSVFLAKLAELPGSSKPDDWALAGELARSRREGASAVSSVGAWPSWEPESAKLPPEDPDAERALRAYAEAEKALDRYRDSGLADLPTLESATALLRKAQAARFFRPGAGGLTKELRSRLNAVYRKIKQQPPDALFAGAEASTAADDDGPTGVRTAKGPGWLELKSPSGSLALAPSTGTVAVSTGTAAKQPSIKDGGRDADPWRLLSLRVEWDASELRLALRLAGSPVAAPIRPRYSLYMDLNRVLGAGRTSLLDGRGLAVPARDAWELALVILGTEAKLYRAGGGAEPEEAASLKADWDEKTRELRVALPRERVRGSPDRWGWALAAFAEGSPAPLSALAPLDAQKGVLSGKSPRLPATRVE